MGVVMILPSTRGAPQELHTATPACSPALLAKLPFPSPSWFKTHCAVAVVGGEVPLLLGPRAGRGVLEAAPKGEALLPCGSCRRGGCALRP